MAIYEILASSTSEIQGITCFIIQLFIAEAMFFFHLKKRKRFWLRLLVGGTACLLLGVTLPIIIEQNRCAMACQGYGAVFLYTLIKSSGNQVLQVVLLSHHNQQSNRIDIPTAYDKNTIELPFWQAVLLC